MTVRAGQGQELAVPQELAQEQGPEPGPQPYPEPQWCPRPHPGQELELRQEWLRCMMPKPDLEPVRSPQDQWCWGPESDQELKLWLWQGFQLPPALPPPGRYRALLPQESPGR
ncbi:hypothetical protein AAFF_G00355940 [Aldrovandia affinis]|uniref:Uncharacterized protein n=1 Tax=Aldrovandia affinis TaxID=143900 RepID=A0AAD7R525_9TELE|nr:hypothetical protein AAFF_G00355940 [Aldrovandia affinis]